MSDITIDVVTAAETSATATFASKAASKAKKIKDIKMAYEAEQAAEKAEKDQASAANKAMAKEAWKTYQEKTEKEVKQKKEEKKREAIKASVKVYRAEKAAAARQQAKDAKAARRKAKAASKVPLRATVICPFKVSISNSTERAVVSPEQKKENLENLEGFGKPTAASKRETTVLTPFALSTSNTKPKDETAEAPSQMEEEPRSPVRLDLDEKLKDTSMADHSEISKGKRQRKASVLASATALATAPPTKKVTPQGLVYTKKFEHTDMKDRDVVFSAKSERKAKAAEVLVASTTEKAVRCSAMTRTLRTKFHGTTPEDREQMRKDQRECRRARAMGSTENHTNGNTAPQDATARAERRTRI